MKFKASSKDLFHRTSISVEVSEKLPKRFLDRSFSGLLAHDYWDCIPKDAQHGDSWTLMNRRILSPAQVHYLLKDIDPLLFEKLVRRSSFLFWNSFLVTPNCHRVTEMGHAHSNGQHLIFDDRTRAYRKLIDFRGLVNELSYHALECMKISKLVSEKSSSREGSFSASGSKWFKEVVLGKRTDHSFRMVVVGDPKIGLDQIGIPCDVAESLLVSEQLNFLNWQRLCCLCTFRLIERGEVCVLRNGSLACIYNIDELEIGDIVYRPLSTGDIVLINRPPSIHQHSLIALYAKVLPISSVVSISPLCCLPLRGDFDGDCLHGYIPQSVDSRVELVELLSLEKQLVNTQTGRSLLSYSQDTLVAVNLILSGNVFFDVYQIQQLAMFCHRPFPSPAIVKAPLRSNYMWMGKQLFSMLLPLDLDFASPKNDVHVTKGDLLMSNGSAWICDTVGGSLDFLHASQEVFIEWLSTRGLSVSLADIYLCSDSYSRKNLIDEVSCGFHEAEKTCHMQQFLVESFVDFLSGNCEVEPIHILLDVEYLYDRMQKSFFVCQSSIRAFKEVFYDIQGLAYQYVSRNNSLMVMLKAGSKGSLMKLVQHSMCIGLQHSLVPLSFKMPECLSCISWNKQKTEIQNIDDAPHAQLFIPCGVVQNSFLTGMNPLECFLHSLASRDSSFSDNADLPGTLTRKLMFFMRDLYIAYDGTVRSTYGNLVIQFSFGILKDSSSCDIHFYNRKAVDSHFVAGCPIGSLSACAFSEAAYSALDQPISIVDISPLLNLKKILECGTGGRYSGTQTASLFLSRKLRRWTHGSEEGALIVKNYLERVLFSDIVSDVLITFPMQTVTQAHFSPWVCHFHLCKDIMRRKNLEVCSVITSLQLRYDSIAAGFKDHLPRLSMSTGNCILDERQNIDRTCIMMSMSELVNSSKQLDTLREHVMPILFRTVIKGFFEIKKVDIQWNDMLEVSLNCPGELYLKVHMAETCDRKFWNVLLNNCLQVMELIDWQRSHPDDARDVHLVYGLDSAFEYFVNNLKSAVSDIGKAILPEHLLLVADCLSSTGEFHGLNTRGLIRQREDLCISSPFTLAFLSAPVSTLVKAAKGGETDHLQGSVDALAWGKIPCIGTSGRFDILYSGMGHKIAKSSDIYNVLGQQIAHLRHEWKNKACHSYSHIFSKSHVFPVRNNETRPLRHHQNLERTSHSFLKNSVSFNDIQKLTHSLKVILHKYEMEEHLSEKDKATLMMALCFHPRRDEKIGNGVVDIKVGSNARHENTRCFFLLRKDGTVEDFSYRKCVLGALDIIAPGRAKSYRLKWSKSSMV